MACEKSTCDNTSCDNPNCNGSSGGSCNGSSCNGTSGTNIVCVTGIRVIPSNVNIKVDEWYTLGAETSPSNATNPRVSWSSADPEIVSVNEDGGYIYGISEGTTKVYASARDGSGVRDYCMVKVSNTVKVTSIKLSDTSISLEKGSEHTLTATISPQNATEKGLLWYSDNPDVASVEDGVIYANSIGTARITAVAKDTSGKSAYCNVTVTSDVLVNRVIVEPSSLTLTVGESEYLYETVLPNNAANTCVIWSSSDTSVATVNPTSGLVYAQGEGTATIYATAQDGSGKQGACLVTVEPVVTVKCVTVYPERKTMKVGESTYLSAVICPENAIDKRVRWSSSETNVVSVDESGMVTAKSMGSAIITATSVNTGYSGDCIINVVPPEIINNFIVNGTVNASDVKNTDDGFFIMTVSLAELFVRNNIYSLYNGVEGTNGMDVTVFFDDWYLFAVTNGTIEKYGLYKMREQEDDFVEDESDSDDPGVTISFIGLSSDIFKECFNSPSKVNTYNLLQDISKVTGPGVYEHDVDITAYFSKTESKGAYLIAEEYVKFIASTSANGVLSLPNKFILLLENIEDLNEKIKNVWLDNETRLALIQNRDKLLRLPNWLTKNNEKAGCIIYDPCSNTINISDVNNLTIYEKYAILASFTADVNFNSFAAEVEFHAKAVEDWKSDIPQWYAAAIRADMAIAEEDESGYYDEYYDLEGDLVKAQAEIHGEY